MTSCRAMKQQHDFRLAAQEPKLGSTTEFIYIVVCSRCGQVRCGQASR